MRKRNSNKHQSERVASADSSLSSRDDASICFSGVEWKNDSSERIRRPEPRLVLSGAPPDGQFASICQVTTDSDGGVGWWGGWGVVARDGGKAAKLNLLTSVPLCFCLFIYLFNHFWPLCFSSVRPSFLHIHHAQSHLLLLLLLLRLLLLPTVHLSTFPI